ncbi:hypothetical protein M758_9G011500 [Ceratodon purpureus]|uniref:Uncharacterized protein n=1 Tax=Ceratodon purpureus TaxID=3225 RepID=A0A8T0GR51_CERPU|nr:hypothetical protein KC19_9G011900 [Ceratodon purpureus]KAG0604832.1 hypothetical protein M758_9G011500 [Ceratodon purpureus]
MLFTGELDEVFRLPAVRTRPEVRASSPTPHRNVGSPQAHGHGGPLPGTPTSGLSGSPSHRAGGGNNRVLSPGKFVLKKGLEPRQMVERRAEQLSNTESAVSPSVRRAGGAAMWPSSSSEQAAACDGETSGSGQWGSPRYSVDDRSGDGESAAAFFHSHQGQSQNQNQSASNSPLCPGTPTRQHYPQTAPSTPLQGISSPDVKKCIPLSEPRSVLDLTISPLQHQLPTIRATLPRRFRESFLEHNVAPVAPPLSTSPRVLNFEGCGGSGGPGPNTGFPACQFPNLTKTTTWAPDLATQGYPTSITTQKVVVSEEELAVLPPSQSFIPETTSLDDWEAATTTSPQHNLRAKQWMASLLEDIRNGDDSTSAQETEECTTPFTPGVDSCSPHFLAFQRGYGSPCPSDYTGDDNPGCSGLEYLQVESPGDTPRGGGDGDIDDGHNSPAVVGHELVTLLIACAEAVSTQSLSLVNHLLQKLGELASPDGTAMQRVAAYFTEGLACRVAHLWPHIYQSLPIDSSLNEEELQTAFHLLNHVVPYTKFAHFTANDIILQAFDGADRVHVIDFDVKQGLQWPALFQSLAVRECGPPTHIRITGIGECKEDLLETGDRLAEFAEEFNIPFAFHVVIDRLEDVRLWMLHVKENEVVAVNCISQLHRLLYDSGDAIKDFLNLIGSTKPKVVAIVEQEGSHNSSQFEGRFLESLQYYSAIFDSLDASLGAESSARVQVEQLFAREIRNILSCEGPERVERHEAINKWRSLLSQSGFVSVPLEDSAQTQAQILLRMFDSDGYTLTEDNGALTLGWMEQPLLTVSAWKPDKDFIPTGTSLVTSEKPAV